METVTNTQIPGTVGSSDIKNKEVGVYTVASVPSDNLGYTGAASDLRIFVFNTPTTQDVTLVIDKEATYKEVFSSASAGKHYFQVQVTGASINNGSTATGTLKDGTALATGNHTYTITGADGTVLAQGTFAV